MKKIFTISIITFLACFAFNAYAQLVTISETHQLPAIGDTVHYVDANSFGFDPVGTGSVTNKLWDESLLMTTGTFYNYYFVDPATITGNGVDSFPSATIARGESGATGYFYYQNTLNNINRVGWFGSTSNYGIYEDGTVATEFHFPITAGNTVTSSYHGRFARFNVGEDSVNIEDGVLNINADMQGTMILPTGTFTNVLRLHVVETFHIKTYLFGLAIQDNVVQDDYYYWFIDTVLQAILVSGVTSIDGSAQTPVLRYQPISSSTGIADQEINMGAAYPNPSNGNFIIKHFDSRLPDNTLEIYNLLGEKVNFTTTNQQSSTEIDMSNSPKGIYFVKLQSGQNIRIEKIVIQ